MTASAKKIFAAVALLLAACSTERAYNAGQGWQQNQCGRIADKTEYDRCMAGAAATYDAYRREAAPAQQ